MTERVATLGSGPTLRRGWLWAAWLWLAVVLAALAHQQRFWQEGQFDTDVLALLPVEAQSPALARATRMLADSAARRVVILIGAPEWSQARQAAQAWRGGLVTDWRAVTPAADAFEQGVDFYRPWRDRLLTPAQRESLTSASTPALAQQALAALHQPGAGTRLLPFAADPLDLWSRWWAERAGETRARWRDGELAVTADGLEWVALLYETADAAFALDGEAPRAAALDAAAAAAVAAVPGVRVVASGMPLHAEAAAVRANREVTTIGLGSLAAVLALAWLAFRSTRPMLLTAVSLGVGLLVAMSVTALVFGRVHLLTLVFGASLMGVAEDYGIHYFASRQRHPDVDPRSLMRRLTPALSMALATSALSYAALGLAPFPGLRQMALFSVVGLLATFVTVLCWLPWLDRGAPPASRFGAWLSASLRHWPAASLSGRSLAAWLAVALVASAGLTQLRSDDSIRQLQGQDPRWVQDQRELGRLLGVTSPVQFFLVQGAGPEEVLQREEALKERLRPLLRDGSIGGWRALSDWVPSQARQHADAALTAQAETPLLAALNSALGEQLRRPDFAPAPLRFDDWIDHPVSAAARELWLGDASLLMLRDLNDPALLPRLAAAAQGLDGVRWVDQTAEVSSLLGRYRVSMAGLLLLAHAAVLLALTLRFGRHAWRAWLPTVLASLLTLAALGWLGQPLQLFNVLALALLLGLGVDYGIFLHEHADDGSAWLAVLIGSTSTWLAFGLLALSSTPALGAFGLTLLIGLGLVVLLAPLLRDRSRPAYPPTEA